MEAANKELVEVIENRQGMVVKFAYHPEMVARMKRIAGVEFDDKKGGFVVPKDVVGIARKAVEDVRAIAEQDAKARESIEQMATATARAVMRDNGSGKEAKPQVSFYHEKDKVYRGEIINANGRYVAQLTGFGNEDGAAFVTLHRLADLNTSELFKGERFAVSYDAKGRGTVEVLPPEFDKTLGKEVDGVKVVEVGDKFHVSFSFNPEMSERLNRVAGVEFDQAQKLYTVPLSNRQFVERAVGDMRKINAIETAEMRELQLEAESRIDGAKIVRPLLLGGQDYKGEVVAVAEKFALQHTGREYFTAHRLADLDRHPAVGEPVKIRYQKSRGQVENVTHGKERGHGR
jgi:hypothetical protein